MPLTDILDGLKVVEVNGVNKFLMFLRNSGANRNIRIFTGRDSRPDHIKRRH